MQYCYFSLDNLEHFESKVDSKDQVDQGTSLQNDVAEAFGKPVRQETSSPEASRQQGKSLQLQQVGLVSAKDLSSKGANVGGDA